MPDITQGQAPTLGNNLYDFRARIWSTELGAFLQPDQYGYLSRGGTLWSWPGNNPFRWRDPSGRVPAPAIVVQGIELLSGLAPGVAANNVGAVAATGAEGIAGVGAIAPILAYASLRVYWGQVEALGEDIFDAQNANADAIARAAAVSRAALTPTVPSAERDPILSGEHTKNPRPSNLPKHEKGQKRKKVDQGGEKGDCKRPYRRTSPKKKK